MKHLDVLSGILVLLVGACAIAYFQQRSRRFSDPILGFLLGYMIVYNLNGLVNLFLLYFNANFSPQEHIRFGPLFPHIIYTMVQALLATSMSLFLFKAITRLREKKMPGWFLPSFIFFMTFLIALHLLTPRFPSLIPQNQSFLNYWNCFHWALMVVTMGWLLRLQADNRGQTDPDYKCAVSGFAWLFLGRIPIQTTVYVLYALHARQWEIIFSKLLILYTNLIPLVWLKHYFTPWAGSLGKLIGNSVDMQNLKQTRGLSDREMEILHLIVDGKSYKEMEAALFISIHTVKSHVYNLYRKMGVKSRHQLIHLISTLQQEHSR